MSSPVLPDPTFPLQRDLRGFLHELEQRGRLRRLAMPISLVHELTEIHRRVLLAAGPALLIERPVDALGRVGDIPILVNLFGTTERIAWGLGIAPEALPALGDAMAGLRDPRAPRGLKQAWGQRSLVSAALSMRTRSVQRAQCQTKVLTGAEIDLGCLPIQWCWPGEPAPLITWPLVITCSPHDPDDINVGIYRMQVLGKDHVIVRWLAHRGGARHHRQWQKLGLDMPVAIAIGADPATILAAVMPLPENMSELGFAGLLRRSRTEVVKGKSVPLPVPAHAEIVLEGHVSVTETAPEGPYGDHTGYYNSVESFPVLKLSAVTMRDKPIYLSTYTGRPPDEPSQLGAAMTPLFVPLAKRQFPEVIDLWMPPEACSYRAMVVAIDKRYPGQARRVMMGLWSMLPQFSYTKLIIAVDGDINVRDWHDVMWALATRFDAPRDVVIVQDTPIDYLDFASAQPGLGGKLGLDATNKLGAETSREWGRVLTMSDEIVSRVDAIWDDLGLGAWRR